MSWLDLILPPSEEVKRLKDMGRQLDSDCDLYRREGDTAVRDRRNQEGDGHAQR